MKNRKTILIAVAVAYFLAAPLTGRISFNPLWTHWFSLWTYVWWATAWLVWLLALKLILKKNVFGSLLDLLKSFFKRK